MCGQPLVCLASIQTYRIIQLAALRQMAKDMLDQDLSTAG